MALYKTATGYKYEFKRNGKRYAGGGGFKTKTEAAAAKAERIKLVEKGGGLTQIDTTFGDVETTYLDYAEKAFVKNTYRQKAHVCRAFLKHMGNLPIKQITAHHIFQYITTRPTNNNYNAHRRELCALFSYAKDVLEIIPESVAINRFLYH